MGLSCTVSEINGDVDGKSQIFPTPVYFAPPLELGTGALGQKKIESWATGLGKEFDDIFSRLDTIHQRDGQTPGDSKDRTYALASCGKNRFYDKSVGMSLVYCTHVNI